MNHYSLGYFFLLFWRMFPEHSWIPLKKRKCLHKMENGAANRHSEWAWPPKRPQLLLGAASVTEIGQKERLWDPITLHPWRKEGSWERGALGREALSSGCSGEATVHSRPTVGHGFRNLCHQHLLRWVLCDLNPWPEDKEKGDAWAGFKVMYVLSSTEYNWKFCHAENCM